MRIAPLTRTTARWTAGLLVAAGLAIGIGTQPTAADEEMTPPTLQTLRLDAPNAYVTFRDNENDEYGFRIILRERDQPDRIAVETFSPGAIPGVGRVATRSISGIKPDVAYCAVVQAAGSDEISVVGIPKEIHYHGDDSNAVCADPVKQAAAPDLALEKIAGREEREWTQVKDQAPAYLVNLRNDGADANGVVVVDIATTGVATLAADQAVVHSGWAASGFTCATRPTTGTETSALRCTGGSLKQDERTNPATLVRFTGRGFGYIHATVSVSGGPADVNTSGNSEVLGVRIY